MQRLTNFINGGQVPPASGEYLDNIEPATGLPYSLCPDSDERDVDHAVRSASDAFAGWSRMPASERSRVLLRLADLIETNLDRLARAESIDTGKPVWLARSVDIPRAAANFRFFATAILHQSDEMHVTESPAPAPGDAPAPGNGEGAGDDQARSGSGDRLLRALNYTRRMPVGVAACISPWNLPLYLFSWKVAPALAAGCTVVGKPSEVTPMTAFLLGELCDEAGMPPGVLNIVHGLGGKAGAALIEHDDVAAISFTGGTATGTLIARAASPKLKKLSLELGGKNPTIIFDDADLHVALPTSLRASFANQGEICLCGSRVLVQRTIFDQVLEYFVNRAKAMRIGDPLEDDTEQGALVSKPHFDKVRTAIDRAREEGGTIHCGGVFGPADLPERCRNGYFIRPTVISGLDEHCATNQEEIFGPVATLLPFEDVNEAIALANSTRYGLSASLWTRDLDRAHAVADQIESGTVWINCWLLRDLRVPFGGMKDSGVGREGGRYALGFFTETKNVCVSLGSG